MKRERESERKKRTRQQQRHTTMAAVDVDGSVGRAEGEVKKNRYNSQLRSVHTRAPKNK